MRKTSSSSTVQFNTIFWLHLIFTVLSWVGPFLFYWPLMVAAYALVILQFYIFNRCLMNSRHDLLEEDNNTFYAFLFESLGFQPDRSALKFFVRRILYVLMILFTIAWQWGLGIKPLVY